MAKVGIHPPKTPVTAGSNGIAKATIPNVCKMPGPPAPFVPTPLPNIAKSGLSPKGYSTSVTIEGHTVAIRGATFESMGDMASKGTGGGLLSANTHGPAKFIAPGSMTVKIEGKNVHLLGDPMLNNCGPSGNPPNTGATMMGLGQKSSKKPKEPKEKCSSHKLEMTEDSWDKALERERGLVEDSQKELNALQDELETTKQMLADKKNPLTKNKIKRQSAELTNAVDRVLPGKITTQEHDLKFKKRNLEALEYEKKVSDDCGGGKNIKLKCTECGWTGDFDVVTNDGRVKEVKTSAVGFSQKKEAYDGYKKLVEINKLLGDGMIMKVAVPPNQVQKVIDLYPELDGLVQAHTPPGTQDLVQGH